MGTLGDLGVLTTITEDVGPFAEGDEASPSSEIGSRLVRGMLERTTSQKHLVKSQITGTKILSTKS